MSFDPRRLKSLDDFRHEALSETLSTNSECLARARAGDTGCLWVTAERQTGGAAAAVVLGYRTPAISTPPCF